MDKKGIVLELHAHQATGIIFALLFFYGITFIAGYFWGKKSALQEFADQIKNESFSDKVYASLCSLYDVPPETTASRQVPSQEVNENSENKSIKDDEKDKKNENGQQVQEDAPRFRALLIGYATENQAQAYVDSLVRRGIEAQIIKHSSTSARGKKKAWFQVVTMPQSYLLTQKVVERLSIEDRLAGVSIVEEK